MTLDALIERLGGELRAAKQRLVTKADGGNADLDPRVLFVRGDEPVALAHVWAGELQEVIAAAQIGAGGFDADITAVCYDAYTYETSIDLDAIVEELVGGGDPALDHPVDPTGEALQIYAANRAGDLRWVEHRYRVDGPAVTWAKIVDHGEQQCAGDISSHLKQIMAEPSLSQAIHRPDAPGWVRTLAQPEHLDPDENRWVLDVGTAQTIKELLSGQACVTLYARYDTPRHRVMQQLPLSSFPFL